MDITKYLNRPWISGEADCWALVRDIYRQELGIELPVIDIDATDPRAVLRAFANPDNMRIWHPVDKPRHLDLIFLASRSRPSHVAVYLNINGGYYLHSYCGAGSVCESVFDQDISGFGSPSYYRHISRMS